MKHGDKFDVLNGEFRYAILNGELKKRKLDLLGGHDLSDFDDEQYKIFVGLMADRLKLYEEMAKLMTKDAK